MFFSKFHWKSITTVLQVSWKQLKTICLFNLQLVKYFILILMVLPQWDANRLRLMKTFKKSKNSCWDCTEIMKQPVSNSKFTVFNYHDFCWYCSFGCSQNTQLEMECSIRGSWITNWEILLCWIFQYIFWTCRYSRVGVWKVKVWKAMHVQRGAR